MRSVFVLQHAHSPTPECDEVKLIGVYRTRAAAEEAVARLRALPGFKNHPQLLAGDSDIEEGFYIDEYQLDKDHWAEGFITWAEAMDAK